MRLHGLIREFADEDRVHDPWGAGMSVLGPICDVMSASGNGSSIPGSVGYSPGYTLQNGLFDLIHNPVTGENYVAGSLVAAIWEGRMTFADLEHAARVLDRYLDLVRAAGRDY